MKKYLRRLLALAGITAVLALAGCGGGGEPSASATPAPTGSAEAGQSGNNPNNAIKEGEIYRYYVWNTEDESDPFKNIDGVRKEMAIKNKAEFEEKYGVTVRYVLFCRR